MTFWQSVFSTFIGAFFGFLFSIVLFYIANNLVTKRNKKTSESNLINELKYNINFLKKLITQFNKCIEKISGDSKQVHFFFDYKYYQRLFLQAYFQQGHLYEIFNPDDITYLDTILNHMSVSGADYINDYIQRWKDDKITKQEVNQILIFERDTIETYVKNLETVKTKIVNAQNKKGKSMR